MLSIVSLLIIMVCAALTTTDNDIAGLYVTKKPNSKERKIIMHNNGYKKFLYTASDEDTLYINKDKTFIYINNYCNGVDKLEGKWRVENDNLSLSYSDTSLYKNTSFKVLKNKLYRIDNAVIKDNKKIKHLTLYKKP